MNSATQSTSDTRVLTADELLRTYGTSTPSGDAQINSVKSPRISTGTMYCAGNAYIYGRFGTPVKTDRIYLADGSAAEPSLTFESDHGTGVFYDGSIHVGVGGVSRVEIDSTKIAVGAQISTISGDLVLNPIGPNINFSGKNLIGLGGLIVSAGSPGDVIVNVGGTLSGEAHLSAIRGGTGLDTSGSTGFARVVAGAWSVSPLSSGDMPTTLSLTNLAVSGISTLGATRIVSGRITTAGSIPTTVISASIPNVSLVHVCVAAKHATDAAIVMFDVLAKQTGTVQLSTAVNQTTIIDPGLAGIVAIASGGSSISIIVTGIAATSIDWSCTMEILDVL